MIFDRDSTSSSVKSNISTSDSSTHQSSNSIWQLSRCLFLLDSSVGGITTLVPCQRNLRNSLFIIVREFKYLHSIFVGSRHLTIPILKLSNTSKLYIFAVDSAKHADLRELFTSRPPRKISPSNFWEFMVVNIRSFSNGV